jgi:uncharacterized protein (UPF0548 family)
MLGDGPLTPERATSLLSQLQQRPLNYDPARVDIRDGWHVDDVRQPLFGEPPGPPQPGGSFERARTVMRHYEVADPALVRAFYDQPEPSAGGTMLLELRFWRLRFHAGVRVGEVYEERRDVDGRPVRVAGWNYRTLEGHLEVGQLAWEVWKWQDSGAVEFRIHAFSRPAPSDSALIRVGLRLVGRRQQLRFYRRACARIAALTEDPGSPRATCRRAAASAGRAPRRR